MKVTLTADEYSKMILQQQQALDALAECHIIIEHMNETLRDVHAPFEGVPNILKEIREIIKHNPSKNKGWPWEEK